MQKKTLVLVASENPSRYSNIAINRLRNYYHPVVAIGRKKGSVAGVDFDTDTPTYNDINTVTLYLNPTNQKPYYEYILSLKPERVIFNPGTENDELAQLLTDAGIQPIEACTLVMLNTGQY